MATTAPFLATFAKTLAFFWSTTGLVLAGELLLLLCLLLALSALPAEGVAVLVVARGFFSVFFGVGVAGVTFFAVFFVADLGIVFRAFA